MQSSQQHILLRFEDDATGDDVFVAVAAVVVEGSGVCVRVDIKCIHVRMMIIKMMRPQPHAI